MVNAYRESKKNLHFIAWINLTNSVIKRLNSEKNFQQKKYTIIHIKTIK